MPETEVQFFCENDGSAPVLEWLDELAAQERRAYLKCRELIERLALFGHELRRPTADLLQDGIYELRTRAGRVHYRMLYFFHGRHVALLAHGLTKEKEIPKADLRLALARKTLFEANPDRHTYRENADD
jgi:phage-related protein